MIFQNCLKFSPREITYNNFEISLVVFMPNITKNYTITNTNSENQTIIQYKRPMFNNPLDEVDPVDLRFSVSNKFQVNLEKSSVDSSV